jgi:hypothetical protein
MNIVEPAGKLEILLSVPTLYAPDFSLRSSFAASTERFLEIIPYRTEERGSSCLPVIFSILLIPQEHKKRIFLQISSDNRPVVITVTIAAVGVS